MIMDNLKPYEERPWTKHYPKGIPIDVEIPGISAIDMFEKTASTRPEKPALHYFDTTMSYSQIDMLADNFAVALKELGIKKNDRISLYLQNIPQFLICQYACWKLGAIVAALNIMLREKELIYHLDDCRPKIIVSLESTYPILRNVKDKFPDLKVITTSELDFLDSQHRLPDILQDSRKEKPAETLDMMELLDKYSGKKPPREKVAADDIALLVYTAGTTGPSKGAMIKHGATVLQAGTFRIFCGLDASDVILAPAPLFHATGLLTYLATAAALGVPIVLGYRFDAKETLRLIEQWRATFTLASVTVFRGLLNHPDMEKRDISSLRKVFSAGAAVSQKTIDEYEEITGNYIHQVYGLTEFTTGSHFTPLGLRSPVDEESGVVSIGLPISGSDAGVVDLESGTRAVPVGEEGEIILKGPMLFAGYWNKPEETAHALRNGWLYTGDVGKMDKEGWFHVIDRKKDLINVSGYKVWPREIEDVLYHHPAVKETCVVGMPDPYRGETVTAFICLREGHEGKTTEDEIIAFCKERMAAYKYPRKVEFVDEIPKSAAGKYLRRALRDK